MPAPLLKVQNLSRWAPAANRRNPITVLQEQEADRLPWLVASAVLAARSLALTSDQQGRVARSTARAYRKAMQTLAAQSLHQVWAQRFDVDAYVNELQPHLYGSTSSS